MFSLLFFGFIALFLFIVFTKTGRGWMFGGKIVKTLDREIKQKDGIQSTTIRVHVVEKKKEPVNSVAIELTESAKLAWSMKPITLNKEEASQLISMLQEAVE